MSRYQQHRHQMVETHIKQYLPSAQSPYGQKQMMCNLRILTGTATQSCPATLSTHSEKHS